MHLCSCKEEGCVRREGVCGYWEFWKGWGELCSQTWTPLLISGHWSLISLCRPFPPPSSAQMRLSKWIRMKTLSLQEWRVQENTRPMKIKELLLGLLGKSLQLLPLELAPLSCHSMRPETEASTRRAREKPSFDLKSWSQRHLKPNLLTDASQAISFAESDAK